jgi:prepilin-type N-terminal cleavage/methylation domain-containing protein
MLRTTRGFTFVEMIVVMLMLAVVASIALPRAVKSSPELQVDLAARALARDLEQLRMRAISAKRSVRVIFDESQNFYTAFMDLTPMRSGSFSLTDDEVRESGLLTRGSSGGVPGVRLRKNVEYGSGSASAGPQSFAADEPVDLENDWVEFDARGMVTPAGSSGVIYLVHSDEPAAVAAVTISGASAFNTWRYRGGRWIK